MRILVIDDNDLIRQSMAAILHAVGAEVEVAEDGPAGLAAARERPPALVFCDRVMPGMAGDQVLKAWRADPVLGWIPFVFLTGQTEATDDQDGSDATLLKPFQPRQLVSLVERLTGETLHGKRLR